MRQAAISVREAGDFSDLSYAPLVTSRLQEGDELLRQRFRRDGYLYFPKGLGAELISPVREGMLEALAPHIAWDAAQHAPVLRGEPLTEGDALWDERYPRIQALEPLHQLFHSEAAMRMMQVVAGPEVFPYPMKMARVATPRMAGHETPPHQDAHSHHTGPSMGGMWVALHDAGESMGRLAMLPGSHLRGVRPVHEAKGVGGVQCEIYSDETLWHVSDVSAGDVIVFHSQTVHRAQANSDPQRVRMSVDTRFCRYGEPVFRTNLEPHHAWRIPDLSWESVYRDWQDDHLQYYWEHYPSTF